MSRPDTHPQPTAGALWLIALCLVALLAPVSASAAERVGRVLIASGEVTAQREGVAARSLSRKDPIYAQDTIETGADGRIQIQFSDGGMVDLQPDSRFRIAEYELEDDGGGSAVMEFLRGALRTVTGSIGHDEDDEYRMDTPVATIGIRGTAYALHYCDANCADNGGDLGLYGRVDNGQIMVGTGGGAMAFQAGQFFFVPEDGAPRRIVAPPDGILDGNGGNGDGDADGEIAPPRGETPGPAQGPETGLTHEDDDVLSAQFRAGDTTEPRPGVTGNVVFGGAFVAGNAGEATTLLSPAEGDVRLRVDDNTVVGADFPSGFALPSEQSPANHQPFSIGSVDGYWGRWEGPVRSQADVGGGGFAYAYTDSENLTSTSFLEGGSPPAGYSANPPDSPLAIASNGTLWDLSYFNMQTNFSGHSAMLLGFDIDQITGSGSLSLDTNGPQEGTITTATSSVTIPSFDLTENGSWSGTLEGRFVGDNGEAVIIKYDLNEDNGSEKIRGVAIIPGGA